MDFLLKISKCNYLFFALCELHFGNFYIYNINTESKLERENIIKTAIAIQSASGSEVSEYFIVESEKYINGEITLNDLEERINEHYKAKSINKK